MAKALKSRWAGLLTIVALSVLGPRPAHAVVITFEEVADLTILDDQYHALGIDFEGSAQVLEAGGTLNPDFPPFSGNHVAYNLHRIVLAAGTSGSPWSSVGVYVTGGRAVTMTAYGNSLLDVLGSVSTPGANEIGNGNGLSPNIFLFLSNPNIRLVLFSDSTSSSNSFTIDDLRLNEPRPVSPDTVPEPTSVALIGGGLLALGALRRRTH